MKKLITSIQMGVIAVFVFANYSETVAKESDTLTLTLKVKPEDYKYPQVMDSMVIYNYNSSNDSVPNSKIIQFQDNELRDTANYYYEFDTIIKDWFPTRKEEIIYNNGDNDPSIKTYEWNEVLQRWINKEWQRKVENNKVRVNATYEWNSIINEWVGQSIDSSIVEKDLVKLIYRANGVDQNNEWIPSYQQEYEYQHYVDSTIQTMHRYTYDNEEQEFEYSSKQVTVTHFGLLQRIVSYEDDGGEMILDKLSLYEYDNNGNRTRTEKYDYNQGLQQWEINEFWEYTYNSIGKVLESTWNRWSNSLQSTYPYLKTERVYFNNLISKSFTYRWNGVELEPDRRYEYTYNSEGKYLSRVESHWNLSNLSWDLASRTDYVYDELGRILQETEVEPDASEEGGERVVSVLIYTWLIIDGKDYLGGYSNSRWDNNLEKLVGSSANQSEYDKNGNRISYTLFRWDSEIDDWYRYRRTNYYLSALPGESESTTDTVVIQDTVYVDNPVIIHDTIYQDLDTINVIVYDTVKVIDTVTVTVSDTTIFSSIDNPENETKTIEIYPNPASEFIYLNNPFENSVTYEIRSIDGKILLQGNARGNGVKEKVNIDNLKTGAYIILLYNKDDFYKQLRFLKQ